MTPAQMSVAPFWTSDEIAKLREVWPQRRWSKRALEELFPGRRWAGIVQKARVEKIAKIRGYAHWDADEDERLWKLYPRCGWEELTRRFPRRTNSAIEKRAAELGIIRERTENVSDLVLVQELRRVRRMRRLTTDTVAQRFASYGSAISNWEIGGRQPTVRTLIAWANALGFDIVLQPKGIQATQAKALIDLPGKHRLMGRSASVSARRPT